MSENDERDDVNGDAAVLELDDPDATETQVDGVDEDADEELDDSDEELEVSTKHDVNYAEENRRLFYRLRDLQSDLDAVVAEIREHGGDGTPAQRGRRRVLERKVDDLKTQIFEFNLGLALSYAGMFTRRAKPVDTEDIEAFAKLGLWLAITKYDPDKATFGWWARKHIKRHVLRTVRDLEHKMTPTDFERRKAVLDAEKKLQGDDPTYRPTDEDIHMMTGLSMEQIGRIRNPPTMVSWSTPVGDESSDGVLGDLIEDDDQDVAGSVIDSLDVSAIIRHGLPHLTERELFVLTRREGLDGERPQRLASIAKVFNRTRESIRLTQGRALAKLGHPVLLRAIVRDGRP